MKLCHGRRASGEGVFLIAGWLAKALRFTVQNGAKIMSNDRVNPSSKGWGVAAFIVVLAILANVTAYSIHKATYLKPDKASPTAEQGR